jgi:hypothetical protein
MTIHARPVPAGTRRGIAVCIAMTVHTTGQRLRCRVNALLPCSNQFSTLLLMALQAGTVFKRTFGYRHIGHGDAGKTDQPRMQ